MKGRGPSVLVTFRVAEGDRALLDALVVAERIELEPRGIEASLSSVMRRLIRQEALARGIDMSNARPSATATLRSQTTASMSQAAVRALLRARLSKTHGLAARIARHFGVEPAQVSRFKAGKESFPADKLDELFAFLKDERSERA